MPTQYTPQQIHAVEQKLPPELKEAIYSAQTAEIVANACEQYGIGDHRIGQIKGLVDDVLMGFLVPADFEQAVRERVSLPKLLVKPIASEINRLVFFPVKAQLMQIHQMPGSPEQNQNKDIAVPTPRHRDAQPSRQQELATDADTAPEDEYIVQEETPAPKTPTPMQPDAYREPIE
jgi:hypothetical protein